MASEPTKLYSQEEISKHNSENDLWIVINNKVYDVTKFSKVHPGGKGVLLPVAGKDATEQFFALHKEQILIKMGPKLCIGHVQGQEVVETSQPGDISEVPYAESSYWQKGMLSPYYNESHKRFRIAVRKFIDTEIIPFAEQWEENNTIPSLELYQKIGAQGIWAARSGPGPHLKNFKMIGGITPEEFDYFHELIVTEEFARIGCPGVNDALGTGLVIGLPPIMKFGSQELQDRTVMDCLTGKKRICLAISDPDTGSDVAGLTCVAKLSDCKQFYIVNGTKKWITNGQFCDYFTTAVRTGDKGYFGISLMVIERGPGVSTKPIKTSYSSAAGTTYITFDDVKVPVSNLLGKENEGFKLIMQNFNHERWYICCAVNRYNRLMIEECFKWATQRKVFGKPLISQPVIRNKLAHMVAQMEACQNWIENITFQMTKMNHKQQTKYLAGPIALLKLQCTRVCNYLADQACQIFGGRAITRTGMGNIIERFQKSQKFGSILGGSEEIMADFGIKMAMKDYPQNAKL